MATTKKEKTLQPVIIPDEAGNVSLFTNEDVALFKAGTHHKLYEKLGAHTITVNGKNGTYFAVWAPNARFVSLIGNFNSWGKHSHPMNPRADDSGIWEIFVEGIRQGEYYKYFVEGQNGHSAEKADPYATHSETPPHTASVVWNPEFKWTDKKWLTERKNNNWQTQPMSIYELHMGSWRRNDEGEFLTYREIAAQLPGYCKYMGFTHVEFMPVAEHPFYGSWGYQLTGYFAPSSRFGTPEDFMYLVNELHNAGIAVLLDWVPSHFPVDEHGLGYFDGTHLYEHADPRQGFHPDWKSYIFNYSRYEVRAFLISNALFWLDKYHIDGLRVDAVASMLYLDYSRNPGEWITNEFGGRENLESVDFLRAFNTAVHNGYPDTVTIAEESSAWPGVTHPVSEGGLGFDLKWMMGWMHDTLQYFSREPVHRGYHQDNLVFNIHYMFDEKFVLPLSHDEVVHGKYSMINKMPGDEWQKFANLRLLYGYMFGTPGAKLLFMGNEFAQSHEWQHDYSLDWHENHDAHHTGVQLLLRDLNELYHHSAMHDNNYAREGFEWIDFNDTNNSVLAWVRKGNSGEAFIVICNFTPVVLHNYRIGVPKPGYYTEVLNTDNLKYGGSNVLNTEPETAPIARHNHTHSLSLVLPPLGMTVLKWTAANF